MYRWEAMLLLHIPENCINALKYYSGQTNAYPGVPKDYKAYNTINVLFYEDTVSERARTKEGKKLNPLFISNDKSIVSLCCDLIASTLVGGVSTKPQIVYRVARIADVDAMMKHGKTLTFTSTSKNGFLTAYSNKVDLVLLEFQLLSNTPHADLANMIPDYEKPEEAEVLLDVAPESDQVQDVVADDPYATLREHFAQGDGLSDDEIDTIADISVPADILPFPSFRISRILPSSGIP